MLDFRLEIRSSTLAIHIQESGSRRILYLDTLKAKASPKDLPAVQSLIKTHLRANAGKSVETLSFQEILLPLSMATEALPLLVATGRFSYRGTILQKAAVKPKLTFRGELHSERSGTLEAFLGDTPLKQLDAIFPGWAIRKGEWIEYDTKIAATWLDLFRAGPQTLEGAQKKRFLEEEFDVVWNRLEKKVEKSVLPQLMLSDATGSFANLWMDYGALGQIAFEDLAPHIDGHARLKQDELQWEKDLLEAGFQRKMVSTSRYYCPGEKVAATLQFLLEVGWRCTTREGKQVLLQSGRKMEMRTGGDALQIVGTLQFQAQTVSLQQAFSAKQKDRLFVEIDGGSVGLLDHSSWISLPSGTWDGESLTLPKTRLGELAPLLAQADVHCEPLLRTAIQGLDRKEGLEEVPLDERFQGSLLPHQQLGVAWLSLLRRQGFSALLSDEMGLGKTVQTLAFFSQLRTKLPILIVAPTSLLFNWQREIAKFWPEASVYVHGGAERLKEVAELIEKPLILTSYAILRIDQEIFAQMEFEAIALDESQAIKSHSSLVAQAACRLRGNFRLAITGTPIENRPDELWSQFRFLLPNLLGEKSAFLSMPNAIKGLRVKPFVLKRSKEEVQLHLPDKIDQSLWVEMTDEQELLYQETLSALKGGLFKKIEADGVQAHRMEVLTAILRLRQVCLDPRLLGGQTPGAKSALLLTMAEEWAARGKKALVFSQFTSYLRILQQDLQKVGIEPLYLDGSTPVDERGALVSRFQEEDKPHVFLLSLKAGGVGLNLTSAQTVLLLDPWWNEAVERQAIDRAHRIGQKNTLWIHRLLTPNTIEEKMLGVKEQKTAFADEILHGEEDGLSADAYAELLEL